MYRAKKIINHPRNVVDELIDGMVLAYHGSIRRIEGTGAIVRNEIADGKVGLVIGGGSGHEPLFQGLVGDNLADAAACGGIFAAPTPDTILAAIKAADRGRGAVLVYGNYAGDNMNFDMAAELADAEGIETRTVRVWDDVAAAPKADLDKRRGIAGDVFVIKIAGAAAATIAHLDEVHRIASKARDNVRSLGVSIRAGSLPETGELTFELADDEIEIGMGAHGEPGVAREKLKPADALVDQMLATILDDGLVRSGDEICLMLNDLGATTMMELLIVNRRLRRNLGDQGINVFDTKIGSWLTTQEMAGFSITIMKLDDELKTRYTMPARSWAWTSW